MGGLVGGGGVWGAGGVPVGTFVGGGGVWGAGGVPGGTFVAGGGVWGAGGVAGGCVGGGWVVGLPPTGRFVLKSIQKPPLPSVIKIS